MERRIITVIFFVALAVPARADYMPSQFDAIKGIVGKFAKEFKARQDAFKARFDPIQDGKIIWGQIKVPVQPPVPQDVLDLIPARVTVEKIDKAPDGYPGDNYGPEISGDLLLDVERGQPNNSPAAKAMIANYPRVVIDTRQVPVLGYTATVRDEAYPISENGKWVVYVLERWLNPTPHGDSWKRVELD